MSRIPGLLTRFYSNDTPIWLDRLFTTTMLSSTSLAYIHRCYPSFRFLPHSLINRFSSITLGFLVGAFDALLYIFSSMHSPLPKRFNYQATRALTNCVISYSIVEVIGAIFFETFINQQSYSRYPLMTLGMIGGGISLSKTWNNWQRRLNKDHFTPNRIDQAQFDLIRPEEVRSCVETEKELPSIQLSYVCSIPNSSQEQNKTINLILEFVPASIPRYQKILPDNALLFKDHWIITLIPEDAKWLKDHLNGQKALIDALSRDLLQTGKIHPVFAPEQFVVRSSNPPYPVSDLCYIRDLNRPNPLDVQAQQVTTTNIRLTYIEYMQIQTGYIPIITKIDTLDHSVIFYIPAQVYQLVKRHKAKIQVETNFELACIEHVNLATFQSLRRQCI